MSDEPIEIKIDNAEVTRKLLELAKRTENLRPLMKNIAGIFASSTEDNFKDEGRPDKWTDLADVTKKSRKKRIAGKGLVRKRARLTPATKQGHWLGQILQVTGQLASSVNTQYDEILEAIEDFLK